MTSIAVEVDFSTRAQALAPGILIAFIIAAASMFISEHYGAPAMLFALLIGMAFHFLSQEGRCVAGVQFTSSRLLKIGVALLGLKVTIGEIASLGAGPLLATPALIILTMLAGAGLAGVLGRERRFGVLTAGAVAICGASAALAIAAALPPSKEGERDTIFTVIAVTSLSTIAMIFYPVLFAAAGFDDRATGFLIGATIHDVAQVVGAGYAVSEEAGAVATYVKLLRVACLPIVVIAIAAASRRGNARTGGSFPWFAVGFAALLGVNSTGMIPIAVASALSEVSRWLLVAAIAALGMKTSLRTMADLGGRHIGLVVAQTLFLLIAAIGVAFVLAPF